MNQNTLTLIWPLKNQNNFLNSISSYYAIEHEDVIVIWKLCYYVH